MIIWLLTFGFRCRGGGGCSWTGFAWNTLQTWTDWGDCLILRSTVGSLKILTIKDVYQTAIVTAFLMFNRLLFHSKLGIWLRFRKQFENNMSLVCQVLLQRHAPIFNLKEKYTSVIENKVMYKRGVNLFFVTYTYILIQNLQMNNT